MDRLFEKDPVIRVLSVVLAVLLWFLGTNQQNPVVQRSLTVQLTHTPVAAGLVLMDLQPQLVSVTVRGRQSALAALREADVVASVDLSTTPGGRHRVPVAIELRHRAIGLVGYSPQQAEAAVDVVERRSVSVDIRIAGHPDPDYTADRMRLSSAAVYVSGPQSVVQLVNRVTGVVDVEGATRTVVQRVRLRAEDFAGREVRETTVEPAEVEVTVPLRALPPAKTVPVRPTLTGAPELGFRVVEVNSLPAVITIRATAAVLGRIEFLATAPVQLTGRSSSFTERVAVVLPQGVVWHSQSQVDIAVNIREDVLQMTFPGIPIRLQHLAVGYRWQLEPTQVDVRVEGRRDLINNLTAGMITAFVDARDGEGRPLGAGEHRLAVRVELPEGVTLVGTVPPLVDLTLTPRR
jgi:YbbR domain-containing protein